MDSVIEKRKSTPLKSLPRIRRKILIKNPRNYKIKKECVIDVNLLMHMYAHGHTNEEICAALDISTGVLFKHITLSPEVKSAIQIGKDFADDRVEQSLFKRAVGFTADEVTREPCIVVDDKGNKTILKKEMAITKIVTKYYPPSEGACCMWLKNRRYEQWKDVSKVVEFKNANSIEISNKVEVIGVTEDHRRRVQDNFRILRKFGVVAPDPVTVES